MDDRWWIDKWVNQEVGEWKNGRSVSREIWMKGREGKGEEGVWKSMWKCGKVEKYVEKFGITNANPPPNDKTPYFTRFFYFP